MESSRNSISAKMQSYLLTAMAKYGVKWWNTPGKSALTVLYMTVLIVPLSIDWRSLTNKTKQVQRERRETIRRSTPMPQSGQKTLANINSQCLLGTKVHVLFSLVAFWYEQCRFKSDRSVSTEPRAIFWMTFSSNYQCNRHEIIRIFFNETEVPTWMIRCVSGLVSTFKNWGLELAFRSRLILCVIASVRWNNKPNPNLPYLIDWRELEHLPEMISNGNRTMTVIQLNISWTVAPAKARRNSSRRF